MACVFATHNVLASDEHQADAFMSVGRVLLMEPAQVLLDLLRGGFFAQLEARGAQQQLADVFVFRRVPRILERFLRDFGCTRDQLFRAMSTLGANTVLWDNLEVALRVQDDEQALTNFLGVLHPLDPFTEEQINQLLGEP